MSYKSYEQSLRAAKYILQMRPVFNGDALFSDETENYVSPMEPKPGDTVTIRFRTGRDNVDTVYLISGPLKKQMDLERHEEFFDYYVTQIQLGEEALRYFFEIKSGKMHCFYNKMGVTPGLERQPGIFHTARIFHAGLGQGGGDVSDLYGPLLQRR